MLNRNSTSEAVGTAAALGCSYIMLGHGRFALVDRDDESLLRCYPWIFHPGGYAVTTCKNRVPLYMHRFITRCPADMEVDHINHNKLDNRKCNLRVCRTIDNRGNSLKTTRTDATSKLKGVSREPNNGRWRARAKENYRSLHLGTFATQAEAAKAYDEWAQKRFGEFAHTNQ